MRTMENRIRSRYRSQEDYDAVEIAIQNIFGPQEPLCNAVLLHRFALRIMKYTESKAPYTKPQEIPMEEIIDALKNDAVFTTLFANQKGLQSLKKCDLVLP